MSHAAVLSPVFVQIALTFALLFWMGKERQGAIARGEVWMENIALGEAACLDAVRAYGIGEVGNEGIRGLARTM